VIRAWEVTVERGGRRLLDGVNAMAECGEWLVIVGANGAGKTTLLHTLSGEIAPCHGRVTWKGEALRAFKPVDLARQRASLSQHVSCALPFRALEIVLLGAEAGGARGRAAYELAAGSMEQSGTAHLCDRLMESLSGGEQQRVHWARVLAQLGGEYEGKCLLLDEPISSLDLGHQYEMLDLARSVARAGAAVVAVLHDLNLAAEYADRAVLLQRGRVIGDGKPAEVFTPEAIAQAFGVSVRVEANPVSERPWILVDRGANPAAVTTP